MTGREGMPGGRVIAWAAGLVPLVRRAAWRREWEAEVAYAWKQLTASGPPSRLALLRLRVRVLTCVIDALWEKKETMTMTGLFDDVRHAIRGLMRYPTFTTIAVITLALGIGANTAVFTLVDGVLLSPLPFDDPDELVSMEHLGREGRDALGMSEGLYVLYRERVSSLEEVSLYLNSSANLVSDGEAERLQVQLVTPGFFGVLGVEPALGRTFSEAEGAPDPERVVVLSDGFWRSHFGGDPSAVGSTLDIDGISRRVVGVMPADFGHPHRNARFWLPLIIDPTQAPLGNFAPNGVARLSAGSSIEAVDTEMRGLISRLSELFPDSGAPAFLSEVGLRPRVRPLKEAVVGDVNTTLWILLGTVGFVLLIACANVANLLLVRAEGRQRELALRVAVGAGRLHIVRAFMSESAVLAVVGSVLGIGIATLAVQASVAMVPTDLPRVDEIGLDLRVLGFTGALAVGCALFFGFFPLIRYGLSDLSGQLRDGGARGSTGGGSGQRLRNGLVVVQMALALVLLVGSGLMFRSYRALQAMDPGFSAEGVLTARITVPTREVPGWEETTAFFRTLGERLAAQGPVESVGFAQSVPLGSGLGYFSIEVEDHPRGPTEVPVFARNNQVAPGYLETLGIQLLEGRTFQPGDGAEGNRVAVVTRTFAEQWWPNTSPLGRNIRIGFDDEEWYQIVGVVGDAHYQSLETPPDEMVYWPVTIGVADNPFPARSMDVAIRTTGDPLAMVPVLRREVQALNPRIPISNARTMEDVVSEATARTSFTMSLLGAASGIALLLGLVGIYGVISYVVSQRTREIGVRMALGATAPSVRTMVVRQGLGLAAAGVVIGLVVAGALSSVMASVLYGVSAIDPLTYGAVSVALVAVSLTASWLPAARAAGIDPSRALRSE